MQLAHLPSRQMRPEKQSQLCLHFARNGDVCLEPDKKMLIKNIKKEIAYLSGSQEQRFELHKFDMQLQSTLQYSSFSTSCLIEIINNIILLTLL